MVNSSEYDLVLVSADEWVSGKNALPLLMSLRTSTRVRTFKPVVFKPAENAIVISDKNNDRKFMFLSEETKPDYRPMDRRTEIKQMGQIDHRPLGADSYNKQVISGTTKIHLFSENALILLVSNSLMPNNIFPCKWRGFITMSILL